MARFPASTNNSSIEITGKSNENFIDAHKQGQAYPLMVSPNRRDAQSCLRVEIRLKGDFTARFRGKVANRSRAVLVTYQMKIKTKT